jgi:signal transduction histidine kinase/CheY-like chemotaxis protein
MRRFVNDSDRPQSVEPERPESGPATDPPAAPVAEDPGVAAAARTRVMVGVVAICWAAFASRALTVSRRIFVINLAGTLVSAAMYALVRRRPGLSRAAAQITLLASILMITGLAIYTGHTRAPALWYLVCVPLFAGYVLGTREAAAWTAVAAAAIGFVELDRLYFPAPPEYLVPDSGLWHRIILLVVIVLVFGVVTARIHGDQLQKLEQREAAIRSLLDGLSKTNEEMQQARDQALAASRAKGEFLAMMSHEIRTPLNAVLGLAGVLLDGQLAADQREIVRTIRSSGDSLLLLLNDILDFSKIEAGRLQLERALFDVVDCAEDALDLFGAVAHEKGLDLSCHVSSDVPGRVEGDSGRVRQILVNLVSNAIKFTMRGSVQVHIDAEPLSRGHAGDADTRIHCAVRDTGIGIPADHLATLFKPFSQIDASTTRRFGGTGLGLAICRTLAERMGGRVWAESKKGAGSTFHFTFVARSMAALPLSEPAHHSDQSAIVVSARDGTRGSVASQIAAFGLQVKAVPNVAELKEAASAVRPDVVVVDDGVAPLEAHEALARMHRLPPFVILSTASRDTAARRALRERWGPEPVIVSMPVRRTALREAVAHALGLDETPLPRSSGVPALAMEIPLRILIAEDNPVNQRVALLLLERLGYRADVVGNGAEAIEAVRARPYDIVLMDVRMPEVDGIEATRRIRAELPKELQPRIVALTANAMNEDRQVCEEAGMDDFLSKPVTPKELERALREARGRTSTLPRDSAIGMREIEALRRLTEGSPEIMGQLIDDYLTTAERLVGTIKEAADRGDARSIERAAHSLKGSSGQMGAQQLMLESAAMEGAASIGDLGAVRERLPTLLKKHEGAQAKLAAIRKVVGT